MNNKSVWVYDIECLSNFFSYYAINKKTNDVLCFYIHENHNDWEKLIYHLNNNVFFHIGFNNLGYDYPVLHKLLKSDKKLNAEEIYKISQEVISNEYANIPLWDVLIQQIDVFSIKHYNNKAKSTSLKWLEFTQRWNKLQDMPLKHNEVVEKHNIQSILDYNKNDVEATLMFYNNHCVEDIIFRKTLSKKLNYNFLNYNDVKIGEHLNRLTYEKLSNRSYSEFKQKRTYHKTFKLSDIVEDNIEFKTKYLKDFLNELKIKSFKNEDDKIIDTHLKFANCIFKFAKGGLHSEDIPRIESKNDDEILMEKDVSSYYPASIINSKLYPKHLGIEWYNGVKINYDRRTHEIKPLMKTLDKLSNEYKELDAEQASIKLSLNGGSFGKLGSVYSWQYDPLEKYKITINCELKLLVLIEEFYLNDIKIISANTDGVVIKYNKSKQYLVDKIHKDWEDKFNYILEDTYYNKIIFSSVNDYIAEIVDNKTGKILYHKFKGDYEIDKEPHKNNSQRIVPIAIKEYFINNTPLNKVIRNLNYDFINSKGNKEKTTIYDYCIGRKKAKNQLYHYIEKNKHTVINDKVIRYYIVDSDKFQNKIFKEYLSGKQADKAKNNNKKALEAVNTPFNHMLFMDHQEKIDYNINYLYYHQECMKIIEPIERNTRRINSPQVEQLKLF